MRYLLTIFFIGFFIKEGWSQTFFDRASTFFSENVENGLVDYDRIKENPRSLNDLVDEIANMSLTNRRVAPEFVKAFYINAYNLLIIKVIVDHYPIEGPLVVEGFFDTIRHSVMGDSLTLDQLEKLRLFQEFPDPRLHFVLVCAAQSCPPLANYSFRPSGLDEQLTSRTTEVLNFPEFIRVNNEDVAISKIFDWYRQDFEKHSETVKAFINKYRIEKIGEEVPVVFYDYDWALNEQK